MWSRITLRTRITILTMIALSLVTTSITALSIYNARRQFVIPFENFGFEIDDIRIEPRCDIHVSESAVPVISPNGVTAIIRTPQDNFQIHSIIIAVVFIFIGTVFAYIISGQTLKPIKVLAKKIGDIDANNLDTEIEPPISNDEVMQLTHSFNSMLRKLNRTFEIQKLFAQNAAHELKTPLASIRASIEILNLDDKPSMDDYKEMAEIVNVSTERLIELVEGLLFLNCITDESKWQKFSAREVFENIVDELREDITQRGLFVDVFGDCFMKGDKTLLWYAFFNLVHNAVRYNVDGGKVEIALSEQSVIISDSGIGIPDEHLANIFQPFYCVDESRSKDFGGHGLGMAIAKNILDKHNMNVTIFSKQGQGTKIILDK